MTQEEFGQYLTTLERPPNPSQREAILAPCGIILCNAGPGTGKTQTLSERIVKIQEVDGIERQRILAISRTNNSAYELKMRIPEPFRPDRVTTIHWLSRQVIDQYGSKSEALNFYAKDRGLVQPICYQEGSDDLPKIKYRGTEKKLTPGFACYIATMCAAVAIKQGTRIAEFDFDINNPDDIEKIRKSFEDIDGVEKGILEGKMINFQILDYISNQKLNSYIKLEFGLQPTKQELLTEAQKYITDLEKKLMDNRRKKDRLIPAIIHTYNVIFQKLAVLDYNDQIIWADRLLKDDRVADMACNLYDAIHIDEFQDVDPVQLRIISRLSKDHQNLFCVGDKNQEIFQFAGANAEYTYNALNPQQYYFLDTNYRSTANIVNASYSVLVDDKGNDYDGDKASPFKQHVGSPVKEVNSRGIGHIDYSNPRDWLIVCRTNKNAKGVSFDLFDSQIPYTTYNRYNLGSNGDWCISKTFMNNIMDFWNFFMNPNKENTMKFIPYISQFGRGTQRFKEVDEYDQKQFTHANILSRILDDTDKRLLNRRTQYKSCFEECAKHVRDGNISGFVMTMYKYNSMSIFNKTQKSAWYIPPERPDESNEERRKRLDKISKQKMILKALKPYGQKEIDFDDLKRNSVNIRTIHAAKGMEAKKVLVKCPEPKWSLFIEERERQEKEFKHVLYVALSRAEDELYIVGDRTESHSSYESLWKEIARQRKQPEPIKEKTPVKPVQRKKEEKIDQENPQDFGIKQLPTIRISDDMAEFLQEVHMKPVNFSFDAMDRKLKKNRDWTWNLYVRAYNDGLIVPLEGLWINKVIL